MGKKKKKSKKLRKKSRSQYQNLAPDQLIDNGKQSLLRGKPREAIALFRLAGKKGGASDKIDALLFRGYLLREAQLRKKGLVPEADALRKQALEYMPDFDQLSEDDLIAYISIESNDKAFEAYVRYLSQHAPSLKVEQVLAGRLFTSGGWEFLHNLDESNPLRTNAPAMQQAVRFMNAGGWEEALNALRSVSRSSPFAPLRMFCRAMVAFYRQDDGDMVRALAMIPDDFPLISLVRTLEKIAAHGGAPNERNEAMKRVPCLWEGSIISEKEIADLLYNLDRKRFQRAQETIRKLADSLYPSDPITARFYILEVIWNMTIHNHFFQYEYQDLARDLLPRDQSDLLMAKTELISSQQPLTAAGEYISLLENEFPDPGQRQIARALILQHTARRAHTHRYETDRELEGIEKYRNFLGITSNNSELFLMDMVTESLRLDPHNKKGYELLVELPRGSRPAKKAVETALCAMAESYPEDPYPFLELARLYYEKNAFRKAESVLEEAMKRAPHDNRVIDRHALSLLISAEKNLKRNKPHLVARDIERAEKVESKKFAPLIIEKRMVFECVINGKNLKLVVENELTGLSVFDRLRILGMFILDLGGRRFAKKSHLQAYLEKILKKEIKAIGNLSSSQILALLMPLEKECRSLYPSLAIAPIFLSRVKKIFRTVEDTDIITLFDLLLEPRYFARIKKEIKRRLKTAMGNHRLLLDFYLVALQHLEGDVRDGSLFDDIIEQADGPIREEIRALSRRLSHHASGPLKMALERFDFDLLDDMFPDDDFWGGFLDDDEDFDKDFIPRMDDDELDVFFESLDFLSSHPDVVDEGLIQMAISNIQQAFEMFLDESGLRGAPDFVIRQVSQETRNDPRTAPRLNMMAELIKQHSSVDLSHEAQIFFFGRTAPKRT